MIDFTAEEKELLESFEKNEWEPVRKKQVSLTVM